MPLAKVNYVLRNAPSKQLELCLAVLAVLLSMSACSPSGPIGPAENGTAGARALNTNGMTTNKLVNGTFWKNCDATYRRIFVLGTMDYSFLKQVRIDGSAHSMLDLSAESIVGVISEYYSEPRNDSIPVVFMEGVAVRKLRGESGATLQVALSKVRKIFVADKAK